MATKSVQKVEKTSVFDYKSIKTFEDACKRIGVDPMAIPDLTTISEEFRKPIIAYYKLQVIYKAINNGWKPDWSNWQQYKYYPWFEVLSSGFGFSDSLYDCDDSYADVGSRLCTFSSEAALFIAETFKAEYTEFFLFTE
jgi:hypothetical protein